MTTKRLNNNRLSYIIKNKYCIVCEKLLDKNRGESRCIKFCEVGILESRASYF